MAVCRDIRVGLSGRAANCAKEISLSMAGYVRIVAATHRNLGAMVEEGRFREDLFYRNVPAFLDSPSWSAMAEGLDALGYEIRTLLSSASSGAATFKPATKWFR